ncbi:hypothetical protein GF380_06070 [Candidatus Uhrbacteria bacterium]|nr:hypothetical protein [Candidatus Uhrbacteria bacterium]MBD3284543.1 hypothetical protein [Candidatus Uhrbacteria bacterium]
MNLDTILPSPYIGIPPKDPKTCDRYGANANEGYRYLYQARTSGQRYVLRAYLADATLMA